MKAYSKAAEMLGVTVLVKGPVDTITTTGEDTIFSDEPGSLRRVSGQGDILAGTIATFMAWTYKHDGNDHSRSHLAAFAGSRLLRASSGMAFGKYGRGLVTSLILDEIGNAFEFLFGK